MAVDGAADFSSLGLCPQLLRAVKKAGFEKPTAVQAAAIPAALQERHLVAQAATGTGKTLAYLLPLLNKVLNGSKGRVGWQAVVLVPTRELCQQVAPLPSNTKTV